MSENCIFCKIANHDIAVPAVYEDDEFFAFNDANPQAPIHVLIVPKRHFADMLEVDDQEVLGRGFNAARKVVKKLDLSVDGFRLVVNTGPNGGQTVPHLHIHLLAGRLLTWPPG